MIQRLLLLVLGIPMLTLGARAASQMQSLTGSGHFSLIPGENARVSIAHTATDAEGLPGVAFRVHFDSAKLEFRGFTEQVVETAHPALSSFDAVVRTEGAAEDDGDESTDSYVHIAVADLTGTWPATEMSALLATLEFEPVDLKEGDSTSIRFTAVATAPGYTFVSEPVLIEMHPAINFGTGEHDYSGEGGVGSIEVLAARSDLEWSASTSEDWISLHAPEAGVGTGMLDFTLATNPSVKARSGEIVVNGKSFAIVQAGLVPIFQVDPTAISVSSSGESGSITVTTNASDAPWTVDSDAPWLTISGGGGVGGGSFSYTVAPRNSVHSRSTTIQVGTAIVTLTQAGAETAIQPSVGALEVAHGSGNHSVQIQVTPPDGEWQAVVDVDWLALTSSGGVGSGYIDFQIEANASTQARQARITVGDASITLTQAGKPAPPSVEISVSPDVVQLPAAGGLGMLSVEASDPAASWSVSSGLSWISGIEPIAGSGNATVRFMVAPNDSLRSRVGTLVIDDNTIEVNQAGATPEYSIEPRILEIPSEGGRRSIKVTASPSDAPWSVMSLPEWIEVEGALSGDGSGIVELRVTSNAHASERAATIEIAGLAVEVIQLPGTSRSVWADADTGEDGRFESQWFGTFWMFEGHEWYYHVEHGWIYADVLSQDITHWYMINLGWTFTSRTYHPWFYRFESEAWMYYLIGSGTGGVRWFYDQGTNDWFGIGPSGVAVP